jgi:hypothetical protein
MSTDRLAGTARPAGADDRLHIGLRMRQTGGSDPDTRPMATMNNPAAGSRAQPRFPCWPVRAASILAALCAALWLAPARAGANPPWPSSVSQGALVIVRLPVGTTLRVDGDPVRVGADGVAVFGAGRDAVGPMVLDASLPDGEQATANIAVTPRDWPLERVDGVPPKTVNPPPALAARIQREQAAVTTARLRNDAREDFLQHFTWPVHGRISGRFGNQRIYNGEPRAPHSGMDIAVPVGTPVHAPAAGIITFAQPDLYLTGGTVLLDHGFGLSSNFLHLSELDVTVGERVRQGQVIGRSGMTGRASGPHLHWGFNWLGVRLDSLLLPGISTP